MRAYQILNETKTTLSALYKNGFPDRDEEFWNEVTRSDLDIPLEINKIAPYKLGIILTSQYRIEHIDELVLKGEQKRVVNQYRKDPNLSDSIIVMSDGRIIDGNHRALAAYLTKRPINYVDLNDLAEITEDEDYRIDHRAPMHDSGSPLYDVTGTYPDDIYGPKAIQYYGTREPWDSRSIRVIQLSRNKPNQTIQIFRAVPKEVKSNTINPGDWVTASKEYAAQHGRGLGKYKVLTKIVPAKTLFTNGDSIHEWGYDPGGAAQPVAEDNASPTKISFKVKKGRGRFATEMIVNGQQAGVYQYDANTGRSIAEVFPEFRSQGLGKILVLHAIYTAAKLGLDFQEDESRTAAYDNVLDSLSSNGYIVDDDGYWYVTGEGEQYLQQALKNKAQPVAEGVPQPGESSGAPKNFGPGAKIETRQMTVTQLISAVPGVPYYRHVVDDWDAKDYNSWNVTTKTIEYATYLRDHPESLTQLPPILVLNGKFEDGAHRVSAIWLLQQRMDTKNPIWANAKLNVQFIQQPVAEDTNKSRGWNYNRCEI